MLWNLFRSQLGCTAYYEPLNERRWFDPAVRGSQTDPTHKHVEDYWREYDGLECLCSEYRESWIDRNLYMDSDFWEPGLKRYIQTLINRAPQRPVLQFNRVDFRLAWLRSNFPEARIVHLYRHPRDQWCSTLMAISCYSKDDPIESFRSNDKFYLLNWCRDLKYTFPFLDPDTPTHPYRLFYFVWRLSYLFGVEYSDISLSYESIVEGGANIVRRLFTSLDLPVCDLRRLAGLIEQTPRRKWTAYADDKWFRSHESACESVLGEFFNLPSLLPARNEQTLNATGIG